MFLESERLRELKPPRSGNKEVPALTMEAAVPAERKAYERVHLMAEGEAGPL